MGQRRGRLTGIEPTMGCDAGPTLNRIWWVGLHPLYDVHRRQVLNECWPAPAMVMEATHVEDIYLAKIETQHHSDVGPTLYKCYTNVSCLLGAEAYLFVPHRDRTAHHLSLSFLLWPIRDYSVTRNLVLNLSIATLFSGNLSRSQTAFHHSRLHNCQTRHFHQPMIF